MANYKQMAMEQLSFTVADLRNPEKVALIKQTAASLKEADRVKRTGDRLTQRQVALALNTFPGFAEDPDQIGPTISQVHSFFVEEGMDVKPSAVRAHISNLRSDNIIGATEVMEHEGKGRYPLFFFLTDEDAFNEIIG